MPEKKEAKLVEVEVVKKGHVHGGKVCGVGEKMTVTEQVAEWLRRGKVVK